LSLEKSTKEDYKAAWDAIRYSVRGKMYALVGNDGEGNPIIVPSNHSRNWIK
jgi:predicted DNA-binding protein (MmcQ/YjbR family)